MNLHPINGAALDGAGGARFPPTWLGSRYRPAGVDPARTRLGTVLAGAGGANMFPADYFATDYFTPYYFPGLTPGSQAGRYFPAALRAVSRP